LRKSKAAGFRTPKYVINHDTKGVRDRKQHHSPPGLLLLAWIIEAEVDYVKARDKSLADSPQER
jgi:hypothetical protein